MSNLRLYGISNCDTVRKAKKWLTNANIDFDFIDFRKQGIKREELIQWVEQVGIDKILNKRGTTWRQLSDEQKQAAESLEAAYELIIEQPTLVKRPVLVNQQHTFVGFSEAEYSRLQ